MEVRLFIAVSENFIQPKMHVINELSNQLNAYLHNVSYGDEVMRLDIGLIMTLVGPGYENWYKAKKPIYVEHKHIKSKLTGEIIEQKKLLRIELLLNEQIIGNFLGADDNGSKVVIMDQIIHHFENVIRLPTKIQNFQKEKFLLDLQMVKSSLYEK